MRFDGQFREIQRKLDSAKSGATYGERANRVGGRTFVVSRGGVLQNLRQATQGERENYNAIGGYSPSILPI